MGKGRSRSQSDGYFLVGKRLVITVHPSSAVLCRTASNFPGSRARDWATPGAPAPRGGAEEQGPGRRECSKMPPPPSSRGSGPAMPDRKEHSAGRRAAAGLQAAPGLAGLQAGKRTGGGRAARFASPCVRARQTEPGAAAAATTRRPPPRQERPAAASSSALPQAGRRPTDSSAAAAANSHPPGADRRTGPGPSRCLRRRHRPLRAAPAPRPPSLFL